MDVGPSIQAGYRPPSTPGLPATRVVPATRVIPGARVPPDPSRSA